MENGRESRCKAKLRHLMVLMMGIIRMEDSSSITQLPVFSYFLSTPLLKISYHLHLHWSHHCPRSTGHGPHDRVGQVSWAVTLCQFSCWLVTFTSPPKGQSSYPFLHELLISFFSSGYSARWDFFTDHFSGAYPCCLLFLLILATVPTLPCFVPQTFITPQVKLIMWGEQWKAGNQIGYLLHWSCHSAAPGP